MEINGRFFPLRMALLCTLVALVCTWAITGAMRERSYQPHPWSPSTVEQRIEAQPALAGRIYDRENRLLAYPQVATRTIPSGKPRRLMAICRPYGTPLAAAGMGDLTVLPVGLQGHIRGSAEAGSGGLRLYPPMGRLGRLILGDPLLAPPSMPAIVTTLDAELSASVYEILRQAGHPASAVVLSLPEGEVWAAVDYPGPMNVCADVLPDRAHSLRSLLAVTAPASTAKPTAAAYILEYCPAELHASYPCDGRSCWRRHGTVNLEEAIRLSCNNFFRHAARHFDPVRWRSFMLQVGLVTPPTPGLPDAGIVLPTREAPYGAYWKQLVGQEVYVSLISLAATYGTLTDPEGMRIFPHIILSAGGSPLVVPQRPTLLRPQTTAQIREWLRGTADTGTASILNALYVRHDAGGKTGSAQTAPGLTTDSVFVAVAPILRPRWVVAVAIKEGGAGRNAGRLAAQILNSLAEREEDYPSQ